MEGRKEETEKGRFGGVGEDKTSEIERNKFE